MERPILIVIAIIWSTMLIAQTTYYVDQTDGNNTNNGISTSSAFETISKAVDIVNPGDTILIMGEYKNNSYNPSFSYTSASDPHLWHQENSIRINNLHGTSGNYITLKAFDNNTILKGDGANILRVTNSSYLRIEGLKIKGEVSNIPLSTANALQFVYIDIDNTLDVNNPNESEIFYRDQECISNCNPVSVVEGEIYTDISNININRPSYTDTRGLFFSKVHHIDIIDNIIQDMPGTGLRVADCEDINIINNEVYACSRKSYSGTHGLVVTKATSTRTTDDYRIKIQRNKVHHNYNEQFSWAPNKTLITPRIDEGKGISLQRNQTTFNADGSIKINWENGRILVENNVCYFNGFSGVHSNDGNRIDFINNTSYFNSYTKSITEGITSTNGGNIGISAQGGFDIKIINNISVIDSGLSKSAISSNLDASDGLIVKSNIIYGTNLAGITSTISEDASVVALQTNTLKIDPLFVDPLNFNFNLTNTSPAINSASIPEAPPIDFFEKNRDSEPDIGAVEFDSNTLNLINVTHKSFSIYPNPVKDLLFIRGVSFQRSDIQVINLLGQDFQDFTTIGDQKIDLSNLREGWYIIRVKTFSNMIYKN